MDCLKLKKYALVGWGVLLTGVTFTLPVLAQVRSDATLPNPSIVDAQGSQIWIDGGTRSGLTLFHSFQDFSVPTGMSALFRNDRAIQNIFSRVTGSNLSMIDGLIQANGRANLFLLNPNGIVFGPNARLNLGGNFTASTAERFVFESGEFSAVNPQAPPLLSLNVKPGLQPGRSGSAIVVQNGLTVPQSLTLESEQLDLNGELKAGQDITLRSTYIVVANGQFTSGGNFRVEQDDGSLWLLMSDRGIIVRSGGDVRLSSYQGIGASLQVFAAGEIQVPDGIYTNSFDVVGNVQLIATGKIEVGGINAVSSIENAGLIELSSLKGSIDLLGKNISAFANFSGKNGNSVNLNAEGDIKVQSIGTSGGFSGSRSGDIRLTSRSGNIILNDGTLFTAKFGGGISGAITLKAGKNVEINQGDVVSSLIFGSGGKAGDITIEADRSIVLNQTSIASSVGLRELVVSHGFGVRQLGFGSSSFYPAVGDGGRIRLQAGQDIIGRDTLIDNLVTQNSLGNAGNVDLTAGKQIVLQRRSPQGPARFVNPRINVISSGVGNAGDITIQANSLSLLGTGLTTGLFSQAIGKSGNITIKLRDNLLMDGGADWYAPITTQIRPAGVELTESVGAGGNILIQADRLTMKNRGEISTGVGDTLLRESPRIVRAKGNAGDITLELRGDLVMDTSSINSKVFANGSGNAGKIEIKGRSLFANLAAISSSLDGTGAANLTTIEMTKEIDLRTSEISSSVNPGAKGNGAGIILKAPLIRLTEGSQINSLTSGDGDAGNISVTADQLTIEGINQILRPFTLFASPPPYTSIVSTTAADYNLLVQSGIFSTTTGEGNGGNISIHAGSLTVHQGGEIDASTTGFNIDTIQYGKGGSIRINADRLNLLSGGKLSVATLKNGAAGEIIVNANQIQIAGTDPFYADRLKLSKRSNIDSYGKFTASSQPTSGIFASTAPKSSGSGGVIKLTTQNLRVADTAKISVDSQGTGNGGGIQIQANKIALERGNLVAKTESGEGGNILLTVQNLLLLRRNSQISATANGIGNGGNIKIDSDGFIVAIPQENSDITANANRGKGGNIQISTQSIFGIAYRPRLTELSDITASSDFGLDGTVRLTTFNPEPNQKTPELPQLIDSSDQIAQTCAPRSRTNSFAVTGRGGLPVDPTEALNVTAIWNANATLAHVERDQSEKPIVEATHWVKNPDGNMTLLASQQVRSSVPSCAERVER